MVGAMVVSAVMVSGCSDESSVISPVSTPLSSIVVGVASTTTSTTSTTSAPSTTTEPPLFDFVDSESPNGWSVVNDTVMGGVSIGQVDVEDGVLVFTGELSLDNNGGFASVRSPLIEPAIAEAWSTRVGPRVVVEGDGRTWTLEVRNLEEPGGWVTTLPTSPDTITDVTLPWTSFEPVTRFLDPRDADAPLDPRRIVSIAFYLVDGIEGPFRLGLVSIS